MIDNIEADILVKTPIKRRIPDTSSARAIGICISTGIPMFVKKPVNPGLNFPEPLTMKITANAALKPK